MNKRQMKKHQKKVDDLIVSDFNALFPKDYWDDIVAQVLSSPLQKWLRAEVDKYDRKSVTRFPRLPQNSMQVLREEEPGGLQSGLALSQYYQTVVRPSASCWCPVCNHGASDAMGM